jgi:hypothetical protein
MDGQGADAEGDVSSTVMAGTTSHLKKKKKESRARRCFPSIK